MLDQLQKILIEIALQSCLAAVQHRLENIYARNVGCPVIDTGVMGDESMLSLE